MPTVPQIVKKRQNRRRRRAQSVPVTGLSCSTTLSFLAAIAVLAIALIFSLATQDLPSIESLPTLLDPPNGLLLRPTEILDRTGEHLISTLADPAAAERVYLPIDRAAPLHLPRAVISATIAISEPGYWSSPGFSLQGARQNTDKPIAQRLVSDLLFFDESPGTWRRIREGVVAAQAIRQFGRERVLEWYLNSADYGQGAIGIDAAALIYFGKSAADVSLGEAAALAATGEAPDLNPFDTPTEARIRQRHTITRMLELGLIDVRQFREAVGEKMSYRARPDSARDPMAVFSNAVEDQLVLELGAQRVRRGGLRVTSTLDYDLQIQMDCTVEIFLARLQDETELNSGTQEVPCEAAQLLPRFDRQVQTPWTNLQANAVVLDPTSGEVLAMVGEPVSGLDPARPPGHEPGSLLAPYVHLTAYTRGLSPGSLVWDIPSNLPEAVSGRDLQDLSFQGPMRLRTALANDYLVPSLHVLSQMGPENVWRTAQRLGLPSLEIPAGAAAAGLLLEGGDVTLLEISHAYSAFATLGTLAGRSEPSGALPGGDFQLQPQFVRRVENLAGQLLLDHREPATQPVISPQLAYMIADVLSDETARWPSLGHPNPLEVGRPTGAKIGGLGDGRYPWTIGFTPQLVVGVWMGSAPAAFDVGDPASYVAGLWHAIFQHATRDMPPLDWKMPPGLSRLEVCDPSGMLPTVECPNIVNEIYLEGNEPTHLDTLFRKFQINRETGRLATVFTPPELINEQVFLVVPPEAAEWASAAGLPTPPDSYDLLLAPAQASDDSRISLPEMFGSVRGQVVIRGTAAGDDFEFYRLQVGKGLNPQEWLQLGEDVTSPVQNGRLGLWDTEGLSGLFAIQLLVVRQSQRVDTTTIQVTVDNEPPQIAILNPAEGEQYSLSDSRIVTLHVHGDDDLALSQVDFYIDGRLAATIRQPPFAVPWNAEIGAHHLRVEAFDAAGNAAEAEVEFLVKSS